MTSAELAEYISSKVGHSPYKLQVYDTYRKGPLAGVGGGVIITFAKVPKGASELDALNAPVNFMLSIHAPEWHEAKTALRLARGEPRDVSVSKVTVKQFNGRTKVRARTGKPRAVAD